MDAPSAAGDCRGGSRLLQGSKNTTAPSSNDVERVVTFLKRPADAEIALVLPSFTKYNGIILTWRAFCTLVVNGHKNTRRGRHLDF